MVAQLRDCVKKYPEVSEVRVLLGMALCVNFDPQAAIEELRESVRLAPNSFIAQLKMGELWMRLRVDGQSRGTHAFRRSAVPEPVPVGIGAPASGNDSQHEARRNRARRL